MQRGSWIAMTSALLDSNPTCDFLTPHWRWSTPVYPSCSSTLNFKTPIREDHQDIFPFFFGAPPLNNHSNCADIVYLRSQNSIVAPAHFAILNLPSQLELDPILRSRLIILTLLEKGSGLELNPYYHEVPSQTLSPSPIKQPRDSSNQKAITYSNTHALYAKEKWNIIINERI